MLITQAEALAKQLPSYGELFQSWFSRIKAFETRYPLPGFSPTGLEVGSWLGERMGELLKGSISVTFRILSGFFGLFSMLFTTYFLLIGGKETSQGFVALFPAHYRPMVEAQFLPISQRLGAYVRGQLLSMGALAVMLAIGLSLAGVPYAVLLATLSGALEIVPYLGSIAGILFASLAALTISWKTLLAVWLVFGLANFIQGNVLGPFIMARTVEVPPVIVLFALMIGGKLLGLPGAILAVPLAAALMVLIKNIYVPVMDKLEGPP
jgi:predicted PurR-regulated permease PerM